MCGLVCAISKSKTGGFLYKDKGIFLQMLISDMFRGMDSTGVFAVNKYGNLKMIKDKGAATSFINKQEGTQFFDKFVSDYHIVVGHNRKATMGSIVAENAHPFIEGNICLVHNGTLQNHYKLGDRVVDSNAVALHISEHGYKSMLKNIEGAYALIWYNAEEKTLYFCRNAERPLHYVETNDRIYIASEAKMLDWILDRNDVTKYTVQNVPTDKVFKFDMETREITCETKPKKVEASNKHNKHSHRGTHQHQHTQSGMGCGQLALTYSSGNVQSKKPQQPSINTYKSGETIYWKVEDFDFNDRSTKLIGKTLDQYETPVVVWLQHNHHTQLQIDALVNAMSLQGKIQSVTSKRGFVSIYLSSASLDPTWSAQTRNGRGKVTFKASELFRLGNQCFQCNNIIDSEDSVKYADVTVNAKGEVIYLLCEECTDAAHAHPFHNGGYC